MEATELLRDAPSWVGYALVGAPGVWAVVVRYLDTRKGDRKERADLIKLAQEVAADAIRTLQERVDALEEELSELRKEHTQSIAAKDAEIAMLRGELRQAWAHADAYERLLTENGIKHEVPAQPIWRVPAGIAPTDVSPA